MGGKSSKDVPATGRIQVIPITHPSELEHHVHNQEKSSKSNQNNRKKAKYGGKHKSDGEILKFFVPDPLLENNDYVRTMQWVLPPDTTKFPIIYSSNYDISFFQLEKILHRFDAEKYGKVFRSLAQEYGLTMDNIYCPPNEVTTEDLLGVHTQEYIDSLSSSNIVARIAEVPPLAFFPNSLLQSRMLAPMRYATEGTFLATKLALENYGWAINLGGGYHHAKTSRGEGFCVYADIPLAVHRIMKNSQYRVERVLVVDLDAHQGNGFQTMFTSPDSVSHGSSPSRDSFMYSFNDNIQIFDMYNGEIYPGDKFAKRFITYDYPLACATADEEYLDTLSTDLPAAINGCRPDIVFYNAGTDIYEDDPLGQLYISREAIIARDEIVFRLCRKRNIPIVMVLSGGYTMSSAEIIASSIKNLHQKGIISLMPCEINRL